MARPPLSRPLSLVAALCLVEAWGRCEAGLGSSPPSLLCVSARGQRASVRDPPMPIVSSYSMGKASFSHLFRRRLILLHVYSAERWAASECLSASRWPVAACWSERSSHWAAGRAVGTIQSCEKKARRCARGLFGHNGHPGRCHGDLWRCRFSLGSPPRETWPRSHVGRSTTRRRSGSLVAERVRLKLNHVTRNCVAAACVAIGFC